MYSLYKGNVGESERENARERERERENLKEEGEIVFPSSEKVLSGMSLEAAIKMPKWKYSSNRLVEEETLDNHFERAWVRVQVKE